jgi:hypothetical protein
LPGRPVEPLEYPLKVRRGQADTGVGDRYLREASGRACLPE